MKLSICTDVMADLSFTDMLDKCVALGVEGVEMTGGGWSKGPHFRADELLADRGLRGCISRGVCTDNWRK